MREQTIPFHSLAGQPYDIPKGMVDLHRLMVLARDRKPFTFIRFSDGEVEVLRNRKLEIANGVTEFRGKLSSNHFPVFDQKRFDPALGIAIRTDLLHSAIYCDDVYFKGIPTKHNNAIIDREFLLRLNGGFTPQMTFADLFLNSNYLYARNNFFPHLVGYFCSVQVVGNFRCRLGSYLTRGKLISIPDDFFSQYQKTLNHALTSLKDAPEYSLVLSSASSLSNVLGHQLRISRPDLTFIDVGTAINDLLGLPLRTRAYHTLINPQTFRERFVAWRYRHHREYQLQW